VIAEPPVPTSGVVVAKAIDAVPLPGVATNAIGGFGVVRGVTATLACAALSPTTFTAFTMTVYVVPFVSPVIVNGLTVVPADT
jgi:hypothetical protein